jgi:hypothetical protein
LFAHAACVAHAVAPRVRRVIAHESGWTDSQAVGVQSTGWLHASAARVTVHTPPVQVADQSLQHRQQSAATGGLITDAGGTVCPR